MSYLEDDQVKDIAMYFATTFIEEITQGLEGEIDYEEAPFFELVDNLYKEYEVWGCYFCDREIDGNEIPFDPDTVYMCLCAS